MNTDNFKKVKRAAFLDINPAILVNYYIHVVMGAVAVAAAIA